MPVTNSPNMNLSIPTVGLEPGPQYATDVNNSLTLLDAHDHTSGNGVKITPLAISINTALTFAGNAATNVAFLNLNPQSTTPSIGTVYVSGVDLFYVDRNGTNIQLTALGSIAGANGSIANLTPPASVTYVAASKTFVFQSAASISANLDAASLILRNISPNSTFALTLQPPANLTSNYAITLPALPAATSYTTISTSGIMGTVDTSSAFVSTANIQPLAVTTGSIQTAAVTLAKISFSVPTGPIVQIVSTTSALNVPVGCLGMTIEGFGGGGGGGPGKSGFSGGGGASGQYGAVTYNVTPGEQINVAIGSGGAGSSVLGTNGDNGFNTSVSFVTSGSTIVFYGGMGGVSASASSPGTGGIGTGLYGAGFSASAGGNGGNTSGVGSTQGQANIFSAATSGGTSGGGGGGGSGYRQQGGVGGSLGNAGANAVANSGGGGGGGSGASATLAAGGTGGSGVVRLTYFQSL